VFDDFNRDLFAAQVFELVRPAVLTFGAPAGAVRQQIEWIALAQSIYTPDRTSRGTYTPGVDRPFGGWLYTGFNAAQETGRRQPSRPARAGPAKCSSTICLPASKSSPSRDGSALHLGTSLP
jgi:hypothetical protein